MKSKGNLHSVKYLVELALFLALMFLLNLTPIGLIRLGPLNLTLFFLPVIVGTLVLGLPGGLVLGLSFGLFSAYSAFTSPSGLAAMTVSASPFWAVVMCVVPRLLIPVNVYLAHKALGGRAKACPWRLSLAAATGTLTNTVFYLGTMFLIFLAAGLDTGLVLAVIAGMGGVGALGETVLAAAVIPPIVLALYRVNQ